MATPPSRNRRNTANSAAASCWVREAVGSSSSSTFERCDSALAISTICMRATDKPATGCRGSRPRPSMSSHFVASACTAR